MQASAHTSGAARDESPIVKGGLRAAAIGLALRAAASALPGVLLAAEKNWLGSNAIAIAIAKKSREPRRQGCSQAAFGVSG